MDVKELVERAMEKAGESTLRPFAARLGVTHGAVGHWLTGRSEPTFEQTMELAELAGLDPVTTAAEVRQTTRTGARYRRLLQRVARSSGRAAAAVIALGGLVATSWNVPGLSIMSTLNRLARCLPRPASLTVRRRNVDAPSPVLAS